MFAQTMPATSSYPAVPAELHRDKPSAEVEFIEDPEVVIARLQKTRTALSGLAEEHLPVMAYCALLDAAIGNITRGFDKVFYLPIPWETDIGLPSHPSLVADARHHCLVNNLADGLGVVVDSFAEWRLLKKEKIFCCCGKKGSVSSKERVVPIEIVLHHPASVNRESGVLEIKQLVGIRSNDREHIEGHYNLRRDSRVDGDISIISTDFARVGLKNFELIEHGNETAKQFSREWFQRIFMRLCGQTILEPV